MLKMDPFVRLTIGPFHKQSKICEKGGTQPRWNQTLQLYAGSWEDGGARRQAPVFFLFLRRGDVGITLDTGEGELQSHPSSKRRYRALCLCE